MGRDRGGNAPTILDRPLPHSEETERAVLAAILLSPDLLPVVTERLEEADFYLESHRLIYGAMLEIASSEDEVDLRTLQGRLESKGVFQQIGGMAYLAGLDLDLPDLGRLATYVEVVKERSTRRRIIETSHRTIVSCFEGEESPDALADLQSQVLEMSAAAHRSEFSRADRVADAVLERIEDASAGDLVAGLATPYKDFDFLTGGLSPGVLGILAGRPGMGKSALAMNIASDLAIRQRRAVAFFSLEMGEEELTMRVLSQHSRIPFGALRHGNLLERQWDDLFGALRALEEAPLYIDDSSNPSLSEIAARCRLLKARSGLDMIVVDYLQLMSARGHENRQLEIASISRGLKVLAKDLGVVVVALSQLSRACEARSDKRPILSDLRESGAIEQDADLVAFVFREEVYKQDDPELKGIAELIVSKMRNGRTGTVDLHFHGETMTFRGVERHHESGF